MYSKILLHCLTNLAYLTVFLLRISSTGPISLRKLAESRCTHVQSD